MLKRNRTKQKLREGKVVFGTMIRMIRSSEVIPVLASTGWDFLLIDAEHRAYGIETIDQFCRITSYEEVTAVVRVPDKLYHQLAQPLDFGADGLVIPRVETRQEAESIVRSTRYYPLGERGFSRASIDARFPTCGVSEYVEWANSETLIVIQIESEQGVENADELLSVKSIDAVLIGPSDLSQSLGIPGDMQNPRLKDACRHIVAACRRNGVVPGIHLHSCKAVAEWIDEGMRFLTFQNDLSLLRDRSSEVMFNLRKIRPSLSE
jgi:4-hydroxy-2-oxoheptanedioate aldolase